MTTLYRVADPATNVGLWYNAEGRKVDHIRNLDNAKCRDLPMEFDADLAGGWYSATDSLAGLADWFSPSDVEQLAARGYGLYAIDVENYRLTTEPYVHAIFRSELVVARRQLPWATLEPTS